MTDTVVKILSTSYSAYFLIMRAAKKVLDEINIDYTFVEVNGMVAIELTPENAVMFELRNVEQLIRHRYFSSYGATAYAEE